MEETTRERIMKRKIESLKRRGFLPKDHKGGLIPPVNILKTQSQAMAEK